MADFLFELFSEEIPARLQASGAEDLKRLVGEALKERGLSYEAAIAWSSPRRLMLHMTGLPLVQPDQREERRGPRVNAPSEAVEGFLKSLGWTDPQALEIREDPKGKGAFYTAVIERKGEATPVCLAQILPTLIRRFPWPKSMRWGAASERSDALRWIRPLHSILALWCPDPETSEIIPFTLDGIASGRITYGHRFMAPQPIAVRHFEDYREALERAFVILDPERRHQIIQHEAQTLAMAQGLTWVEDEALLEELVGLAEYPMMLLGKFDAAFLKMPPELLQLTIRTHQKSFVLRGKDGQLAPFFLLMSHLQPRDGGALITAGYSRVVHARLTDALYFWTTDRQSLPDYARASPALPPLDQRLEKIRTLAIIFHARLGTQTARIERLRRLAGRIAPLFEVNPPQAERAALLCKADLVTEVVAEFPELQGVMGRAYAQDQGEASDVCWAIEDHYKPQGPRDQLPRNPTGLLLALVDKCDLLVGFWMIGEKPTGSKDPYALRRAALGLIRIILEKNVRLPLRSILKQAAQLYEVSPKEASVLGTSLQMDAALLEDLLTFILERLKIYKKEMGVPHDVIEAVLILDEQSDLVMLVRRLEILQAFLETEAGLSVLAVYRRAANILRAEAKKESAEIGEGVYDPGLFQHEEEENLAQVLSKAQIRVQEALAREEFQEALDSLHALSPVVEAFFTSVTVNAEQQDLRRNRLRLLAHLCTLMHRVADFSKIAR